LSEIEVKVPRFDPAMKTVFLCRWMAQEGDAVKSGEPMVELEGEKTMFKVKAPQSGVIVKLLCEEGTEIGVGETIAIIGQSD
jgi:pyruvate/2-oxoglutarate dehydrogenase complex dihydrolipoamide acyltransferase (E2) component